MTSVKKEYIDNADNDDEKTPYFWKMELHQEFMRHFQIYGKTWKVVSAKMAENGIQNKD